MAEEFQEKTERATPKKKQKAKQKGQVARNKDLVSMITMSGIVGILYFWGDYFFRGLATMTSGALSFRHGTDAIHVSRIVVLQGMQILMPFFLVSVVLAVSSSIMQGGWVIKPLKFEIEKVNLISGIKRLFSFKGLMELLKSLIKFSIGGLIVFFILKKDLQVLPSLTALELGALTQVSGEMIMDALIIAFALYMAVAIVSYFLERWQFERSLKMTKQEVKDEMKESEGDPLIRSRIKSAQREAARRRMMQEVPNATVVITNPTHLAIAVKYDDEMPAPKIVAKGSGFVAEKIRDLAREHGVPLVEDKPLARALFKLDLNSYVPEGLYVAIARILAYIYRLRGNA